MTVKINDLLGINSPKESWGKLTDALNSNAAPSKVGSEPSANRGSSAALRFEEGRANLRSASVAAGDASGVSSSISGVAISRLLASQSRPYGHAAGSLG